MSHWVILEVDKKLKLLKTYVEELFNDKRKINLENTQEDKGYITKEEILQSQNNIEGLSPYQSMPEVLKLVEEIVELCYSIYKTGIITDNWLVSTFMTVLKKTCSTVTSA